MGKMTQQYGSHDVATFRRRIISHCHQLRDYAKVRPALLDRFHVRQGRACHQYCWGILPRLKFTAVGDLATVVR